MKLIDGDYVRDEILYGEAYVSSELELYIKRVFDKAPTIDAVPKAAVEQLKWERDTAIKQLGSYGVGFCEEKKDLVAVVRCKDCKLYRDGNMRYCQMTLCAVETVDFCSYGKEKTDD